ncbi:MAG: esterase/lipase family protein [Solirubrobacteraceae bacterium]
MGVPFPVLTPLWRESRVGLEAAALLRSPVWRGEGVPPGGGRPVLLVPGFLAGDGSLGTMAKWLRANGYWTRRAGIRANVGCSQESCLRLAERVEALAERTGRRVTLVGQSRGGVLARVIAVRRPDLVERLVTLGAPTVSMLAVNPLVLLHVGLVGALGTGHVPGFFSMRCLRGACCAQFRADMIGPFPDDIRYTVLYSRSDGIVDWRACLDTEADELVEIRASHCGMGLNHSVYERIARALADDDVALPRAA